MDNETIKTSIMLGAISGLCVFIILTWIRNLWRHSLIRQLKSEDYIIGWKDAIKEVEEKFGWAKTKYIDKER
jgi:hypothetical protein